MSGFIINPFVLDEGGESPTQIGQGLGTQENVNVLLRESDAWNGVTSANDANSATSSDNQVLMLGKDYSGVGGKSVIGFKAWGSTDQGFHQNVDTTNMSFTMKGSNVAINDAGATTIGTKTGINDANGLAVDAHNNFSPSAVFDHIWVEFPAAGAGKRTIVAELEFWEQVGAPANSYHLLVHWDGTDAATSATDSGEGGVDNPHTLTFNGNIQLDTAQKKFGTASLLSDGTSDYVSIAASADFEFGTGDFTIDFWFRDNASASNDKIMEFYVSSAYSIHVQVESATQIRVWNEAGEGDVSFADFTVANYLDGAWHHIAIERSGGTVRVAVDGTFSVTTANWTGRDVFGGTNPSLDIGRSRQFHTTQSYDGWIDEFRIIKGTAAYGGVNFTPPSAPYS